MQIESLSDDEVLSGARSLVSRERRLTAELIAHLAEIETRSLYKREGYVCMRDYCCDVLGLSENEAYGRIEIARLSRQYALVLELLRDNRITFTAVGLVAPRLTASNHREVLEAACGKTRAQVVELLARLFPRPDFASTIRVVPARPAPPLGLNPVSTAAARPPAVPMPRPALVEPLGPDRYHVHQTIDRETKDLLVLAKDLLPDCTDGEILRRALRLLTDSELRRRFAITNAPRAPRQSDPGSRYVPAHVRREVYERDGRSART